MRKDFAVTIWDACGFFAEDGIRNLIDKSLIKVDETNVLTMHDLLRDMGREIIRNQSLKWPAMRSRLWLTDEVLDVITNVKATNAIEGISLDLSLLKPVHLDAKTLEAMSILRLLEIKNVHITGSFKNIFQELRWLSWHYCNLSCLPSDFNPRNLVMLDMRYSNMKTLWRGLKHLQNLKILNMGFCEFLVETPDFTGVQNLEWLSLRGCQRLVKLHPSIGRLYKLRSLDLRKCMNLGSFSILDCFGKSFKPRRSDLWLYLDSKCYNNLGHKICYKKHIQTLSHFDLLVILIEVLRRSMEEFLHTLTKEESSEFLSIGSIEFFNRLTNAEFLRRLTEAGWIEFFNRLTEAELLYRLIKEEKFLSIALLESNEEFLDRMTEAESSDEFLDCLIVKAQRQKVRKKVRMKSFLIA